ncbi:hypothetical protein [Streptomyces microflavus]|uniref:hypothetical protein n=1 Tax=Streptomyces microflavus TaxID=1919 RepID=UPI00381B9601
MLVTQEEAAQGLARTALGIVTTLNDQRMYESPDIRAVHRQVRGSFPAASRSRPWAPAHA